MRRAIAFASCVLVVSASLTLLGQTQPTFRTGVQLVRIDVSVLDDKRQPVRGLKDSDFTVLEDGQLRPIRSFQAVDVAADKPAPTPPTPLLSYNVATNQGGSDTNRLIFILMDRSIPTERPMLIARQIADAAVDAMGPGDLAAVVTTSGGMPQNLTSDRARLHKAIAASDWGTGLSQDQKDDPIVAQLGLADVLGDPRCMCGLCVMDTIARIANDIQDVPRRKVLLFIGSNLIVQAGPREFSQDVGCEKRVRDSRERLFDALGTSGLTVHSIDPQGLMTVGPATRATVRNGVPNRDGRVLNQQLSNERNELLSAQGNLAVLPDLTGGRTILNNNEPFRMVPAILNESDAYYLIAFEPIESAGNVRHTVDVRVARKGVEVHAARYIAPSAPKMPGVRATTAAASPLERALTGMLANQSVPLDMSVASFGGPDAAHAYVGVTLDVSAFATNPGSVPLEIAVLASDERGRSVGAARQTGIVDVPPGAGGVARSIELQTHLVLPPGQYELRAAVMNGDTRAASSVFTHVTVPSFDDGRLDLSDIVLGTRENAGLLPEGAPAMPIVPTTTRVFGAGAPAWAFLRVYRPAATGPAQPVSVDTTVLDDQGRTVRHQSLQSAEFTGRTAGVRIGLPLKALQPGSYVLRIDAKQGRAEGSRAVAFTVAPALVSSVPEAHSAELDAALAAAAAYLDGYEQRISAIGAEEEYQQVVMPLGGTVVSGPISVRPNAANGVSAPPITRKTRANLMTISLGARGWVAFRDVFELDGRPVRDRDERLTRILQNVTPDSLDQARKIAAESARYNLNPDTARIDRTINVPMTALFYLRAANQSRSSFRLGKPERAGGVECVTLEFTEQSLPRLIRTTGDAPAEGKFWIDMANGGRILKTEMRLQSQGRGGAAVRSQATVTYGRVDRLNLWVPVVMDESYVVTGTRQTVTGHATYTDFKEFKVTTSADIK
jgi:VWFA-related protein